MRTSANIFIGGPFAAPRSTDLLLAWSDAADDAHAAYLAWRDADRAGSGRCVRGLPRRARPRRGGRAGATGQRRARTRNGLGAPAYERPRSNPEDRSTDEHHIPEPGHRPPQSRARTFSRSPPTDCWRTATPPRWSTATARSAGCACRATTARRCSRRSSTRPAGTGGSGPTGEYRSERRYVDGTLVIETTFTTETGSGEADRRDGVRRGAAPSRARDGRSASAAAPGGGRLR